MRLSWILLLIPLALCALTPACSNYSGTIQGNSGGIISFLAPSDVRAGSGDLILTVNGAGFDKTTVVRWNGQNRTTTLISSSQITATIPAADIAQPGTATIDTFTQSLATKGYNGLSNPVTFTINSAGNPAPAITNVNPSSAPAKSADVQLTVTGTNFLQGSIVRWNAANLATKFVSATQLTATVPAALLLVPGIATITVFNPAPGGGTSPNGLPFTVTAATAAANSATTVVRSASTTASAPGISGDGRFVAFTAPSGERQNVFVQDTCAGATEPSRTATTLVSVAADGSDPNGPSGAAALSADGRYIAFESSATNLVARETRGTQIFRRDTCFGAAAACSPSTILISVDNDGALGGNDNMTPSISASGRFIAFVSIAPDGPQSSAAGTSGSGAAPAEKRAGFAQVFVRDTCVGAEQCTPRTVRISLQNINGPAGNESGATNDGGRASLRPALAGNGRFVAISAPGANIFTKSAAVADGVFIALTNSNR